MKSIAQYLITILLSATTTVAIGLMVINIPALSKIIAQQFIQDVSIAIRAPEEKESASKADVTSFPLGVEFGTENILIISKDGSLDTDGTVTVGDFHVSGTAFVDSLNLADFLYVAGNKIIDATGRIPALTVDYIANLDGSAITGVNADKLDGIDSTGFIKTGTAIDADKIDGIDSGSFLRADAADTAGGALTFTATPGSANVGGGPIYINPSTATADYTLFGIAVDGIQKFKVDEDGDVTIAGNLTVAGSSISTGFSEGSVIFADSSGNLAQDNTNFFWNDTTNRLGIGTSSPSEKLHLLSSLADDLDLIFKIENASTTSNQVAAIDLVSAQNSSSQWRMQTGSTATAVTDLSFYNLNTGNSLVIQSDGDVGIGTTNPGTKLEVAGTTNTETAAVVTNGTAGTATRSRIYAGSDGGVGTAMYAFGSGYTTSGLFQASRGMVNYSGSNGLYLGSSNASGYLGLFTGGLSTTNERVRIDSSGNVGIGDLTPNAQFDIDSVATTTDIFGILSTTLTTGNAIDVTSTYVNAAGGTSSAIDINLTNSPSTSANTLRGIDIGFTDAGVLANTIYGLYVDTTTANSSDTTYAATFMGGNVGVGTVTPGAKADILSTTQQLRLSYDATTYTGFTVDSGSTLNFYTGANQRGAFANGRWLGNEYGGSNLPSFSGLNDTNTGLALWNSDKLSLMTGGTHSLIINSSNNVGIGADASANMKLDVAGRVQLNLGGTQTSTALCGSHGSGGTATESDVEIVDCTGTPGADYMEMYPIESDADKGTVVAVGSNNVTTKDGDTIKQLVKSTSSYQSNLVGIVSDKTKAGDFNSIGYNIEDKDNPQPIALAGRVPVKVSSNSQEIQAGNFITSSNEAGKAMKATQAGYVIGKALESWSPNSGKSTVMVFVNNSYYIGGDSTLDSGSFLSLNSTQDITDTDSLTGSSNQIIITELQTMEGLSFDEESNTLSATSIFRTVEEFIAEGIATFKNTVKFLTDVTFGGRVLFENKVEFADKDLAGYAKIKSGSNEVRVNFENEYTYAPIIQMTPQGIYDVKYAVTDVSTKGFTIKIDPSLSEEVQFSWSALAVKDAKTYEGSESSVTSEPTASPSPIPTAALIEESTPSAQVDTPPSPSTESATVSR